MHFSAAAFYLASLMANIVAVTTSIPQPHDVVSRRKNHPIDPFNYQAPKGCFGIGVTYWSHDLGEIPVKRDAQVLDTHDAAALDPRSKPPLACGSFSSGGQSDPFGFPAIRPLMLFWNLGGAGIAGQVVKIMRVVQNGPDEVIRIAPARRYRSAFTPVAGAIYFIVMGGVRDDNILLTWFFDYRNGMALPLNALFWHNS